MKEACNVGRKLKRRSLPNEGWKLKSPSLPAEIIENILFRLSVKDLLRFKVVCKQWEATISDPKFAEIHLHLQRCSRKLLAWPIDSKEELHVAEFRNNCIEFVSEFKCSLDNRNWVDLCSCDGIYLKYFRTRTPFTEADCVKCVLWNPSCRTYREFYCPPSIDARYGKSIHAMYYDPLKKDYKIVIADTKHYAVYSCGENKWGDVKEMKGFFWEHCDDDKSVFVNGSVYWLLEPKYFKPDYDYRFRQVICFDCKDESFKILPLPNIKNGSKSPLALTSLGGQLCMLISSGKTNRLKKIMKRVTGSDEWVESKEESSLFKCRSDGRHPGNPLEPMCQMSENELLFYVWREGGSVYMLYDKSRNTVVEVRHNHRPRFNFSPVVAHLENLLLR